MGLGSMPSTHPNFISMPGMHGSYAANMAMTETDLLIALGVRFDDRVTGRLAAFAPHAKVIHVDIDPAEIGKNRAADLPIVGDVKKVLERLITKLRELAPAMKAKNAAARKAWWAQVKGWKAEHPLEPEMSTDEIKPQHLIAEIDRLSGGEAIVASDVGQHQMWGAQFLKFNHPRLWLNSGGLGSMGFGLPAAIGAQFARPDKLVFALVGDGGFQMSIPELATIANHALPVKIIVMNNGYLGMVRQWQELFYNNRLSSVQLEGFPDPEKLAGAYGFRGRTVENAARAAGRARSCGARAGSLLAERARDAVRERVSHGSGGRRDQRNGAGAGPAGGGVGAFNVAIDFTIGREQAGRAHARDRRTLGARLQHRKPDGRADARSGAVAHEHRGRYRTQPARPGDQADQQAGQRAASLGS